jgi:hypothetical protein
MKKNFAGQPDGGGNITILTAQDLMFDVSPTPPIFQKHPIFVDNCKNCNKMQMENFRNLGAFDDFSQPETKSGGFFSGLKFGDILPTITTGAGFFLDKQKNEAAAEQARLAIEIENQRLQQEEARAKAEAARASAEASKAGSVAGKIKAYILPITITGVLVIGGIAAYFYFKKKKV